MKKYQVFISSTYTDLKKERIAARDAILKTRNLPVGMEQFSASERDLWDRIVEDIDNSDYYVLIIGKKYGSEVPGEEISWTQKEYRYAIEKGIPVLAFIKDDTAETNITFIETNPKYREKLNDFIEEVKSHCIVDFWEKTDDIKFLVAVALEKAIREFPRPGWVRSKSTKPRKQHEDSYAEKALKYLVANGPSSTAKVAKELELSKKHAELLLTSLLNNGQVHQHDTKWQIITSKDDLVTFEDYHMHLLSLMDKYDHIILCGCGTHFWENDLYSDELVSEVIQELKSEGFYNPSDDRIIKLVIKKIIEEADPTFDECPGCGMPRRRISNES